MSHRDNELEPDMNPDEFYVPEWSDSGHASEDSIYAWLDHQLSPEDSAKVDAHVVVCAECSAIVVEARGYKAASSRMVSMLDSVPRGIVPAEDVSRAASRIVAMADATATANAGAATDHERTIMPLVKKPSVMSRFTNKRAQFAIAATLLVMIGGTTWLKVRNDSMLARNAAIAPQAEMPLNKRPSVETLAKQPMAEIRADSGAARGDAVRNDAKRSEAQRSDAARNGFARAAEPSRGKASDSVAGGRALASKKRDDGKQRDQSVQERRVIAQRAEVQAAPASALAAASKSAPLPAPPAQGMGAPKNAADVATRSNAVTTADSISRQMGKTVAAPAPPPVAATTPPVAASGSASGAVISASPPTSPPPVVNADAATRFAGGAGGGRGGRGAGGGRAATTRPSFSLRDSLLPPITLFGKVVDGESGKPISGASVTIPGTTIGSMTGDQGQFELRQVPRSATTVLARSLGYQSVSTAFALSAPDTARVDLKLKASVNALDAVTVTAAATPLVQRSSFATASVSAAEGIRCLRNDSGSSGASPVFRALRGAIGDRGTYQLMVLGWPTPNDSTSASFVLNRDGLLHGNLVAKDMTADVQLSRKGTQWIGDAFVRAPSGLRTEHLVFNALTSDESCR